MNALPDLESSQKEEQGHHHHVLRDGHDPTLPANHPINALSPIRKLAILGILSFAAFLANYSAAAFLVAFPPMAEEFGVSIPTISNAIGYGILGLGVGPIFWNPLSRSIGRRPTYVIGSIVFLPMIVWLAVAKSYNSFVAARVIAGMASSWSQTIPPATIADIYPKEVRGSKMSLYAVLVTIGPLVAPFICGLVVEHHSWRVVFWIVLGLAGLQAILIFFLVPETLWIEDEIPGSVSPTATVIGSDQAQVDKGNVKGGTEQHMIEMTPNHGVRSGHCGPAWMPWQRPGEFLSLLMGPILMMRFLSILLPSIYFGSIFAWSVGITIVLPQTLERPPYSFAEIPLGSSYLGLAIGAVLGKWSGGIVGDKVVGYLERKHGRRQPEFRLYAVLPLLPFMLAGLIIVGVTVEKSLHWIAFIIGGALYYYMLSATTGLLQTYVMEGYLSRTMDCQAVFNLIKCVWGFAVAFFVYQWGEKEGFLTAYATQGALAAGVGALLCLGLIWKGKAIRTAQGMPGTA